ncbi:[histone H3]-lysine(4) N-trimethyltransferase [Salvia divinorum]|uniref:[histone H3]-lysine(4) N-trimethyltransferase n=1 Tax=Salvia divinorum TaxID=28513 RepID=A0ABD1FIU4_SALDI
MPCLSNLINLPASAFPELKPIVYDTRLGPKQAPAVARPRDLDAMKLGPQSEETIDDVKQGELRRNGKGEGAIGRGPNPEFDLKRNLGSPKFEWLFLVGAPKLIQCGVWRSGVYPKEKISCSVRGCNDIFHRICAKERNINLSALNIACGPFPNQPGEVICWKHPTDWHIQKHEVPANIMKDIFSLLPLPYTEEEFKIDINWKDQTETKLDPPSYVQIKRNVYHVKRKRNSIDTDIGCTNCNQCTDGCVCRVQCITCSKACCCSKNCTNRPFQKVKKIQIVKTELCGWGVVAAE